MIPDRRSVGRGEAQPRVAHQRAEPIGHAPLKVLLDDDRPIGRGQDPCADSEVLAYLLCHDTDRRTATGLKLSEALVRSNTPPGARQPSGSTRVGCRCRCAGRVAGRAGDGAHHRGGPGVCQTPGQPTVPGSRGRPRSPSRRSGMEWHSTSWTSDGGWSGSWMIRWLSDELRLCCWGSQQVGPRGTRPEEWLE